MGVASVQTICPPHARSEPVRGGSDETAAQGSEGRTSPTMSGRSSRVRTTHDLDEGLETLISPLVESTVELTTEDTVTPKPKSQEILSAPRGFGSDHRIAGPKCVGVPP